MIETKSSALAQAAEMNVERALLEKKKRVTRHSYSLEGVSSSCGYMLLTCPVRQYCHASSFSLLKPVVPGDARVAKRPRKAGATILGKASLSEFAPRTPSTRLVRRCGQSKGAYCPDADPYVSSSGSGIAASIGLAAVTLDSETDESVTCPAQRCGY